MLADIELRRRFPLGTNRYNRKRALPIQFYQNPLGRRLHYHDTVDYAFECKEEVGLPIETNPRNRPESRPTYFENLGQFLCSIILGPAMGYYKVQIDRRCGE